MKHRNKVFTALLMAVLLLAFSACNRNNTTDGGEAADEDRVLVVGTFNDAQRTDPAFTNDGASNLIMTQMFEALVTHDVDMNIVPWLAKSWERLDDLSIEFKLRDDVYFHNGEKMTADDVLFSLKRAVNSPIAAPILGEIDPDGFEIVDEHTIIVRTKEPFAPLLASLGHTTAFIASRAAYDEFGADFEANPIGTGPFKFVSRQQGQSFTLERNENYWGVKPQISGIEFRVMTDEFARVTALQTGEIQFSWPISAESVNTINNDENLEVLKREGLGINFISLNLQREDLFGDIRVRQAMNYAIDLDLLINTVLEGYAVPALGPMAVNLPGASKNVQLYPYDPDRARELLAEAGVADGFDVTLLISGNSALAEAIASMLGNVGIRVTIEPVDFSVFTEMTDAGNFDMSLNGWTAVTGDPDYAVYPLLHSTQWGSSGNRSFIANPELDALMEEGRKTFDMEERAKIYEEIQQKVIDEAPWIFLHNNLSMAAQSRSITGYQIRLNGQQTFRDVRFID